MSPLAALCPVCKSPLEWSEAPLVCRGCGQSYPRLGSIAVLLPQPEAHVALWRGQLGLLLERGEKTLSALEESAQASGLLPATAQRLSALGRAVREQVADVAALLGPALGGAAAPSGGLPRGVVEHIGYLYRDWGWPHVGYNENDAPLARIAALLEERELRRTLVLGAGACGLSYELHLRHAASHTVVVDIDPYLLVPAEHVVRGERVRLTEASLKVLEAGDVSRAWTLSAPSGALAPDLFSFALADGLNAPFADESFDSVVTPWFIDQVPRDLPALLAEIRRVLRPGGLWLNQGPLIYPEQVPFERRYSADELFDLLPGAGFSLVGSSRASLPYLVSPLTGHGKVEAVLTSLATRI